MFLATTNKARRLLLLSYIGHVRAEEVRRGREEVSAVMADLTPGFRVLANFDEMDSMDTDTAPEIGKLMEDAERRGVEMIVRVIPDRSKDIGLNILASFHYKRPVETVTCETMEEGVKALGL
jgi:anti-anti-sigma regulatory factor